MKQLSFSVCWVSGFVVLLATLAGCGHETAAPKAAPTPTVSASQPIVREVSDYADFTGRTDAPFKVDIRARVTGYLVKMPFTEGSEVKAGDLLFEVDPRPYQASLDKGVADVGLAQAKLKLAIADNVRAKSIAKATPGAISLQDLDKDQAAEDEAAAEVQATKASLEGLRINLEFTKVLSPIDGRISRYYLTLGNLANQDQTLLTTVVSQDPMYAYFDVDELTMLELVREMMDNPTDLLAAKKIHVYMGLADEDGYPHEGYVNFANNVVSASTGTITARGVFANPKTKADKRLLRPGMFVRIRLRTGPPHPAVLVSERALGTDQGRKYLLVIDDKSKVQYRPVTVGPLQDDGLRVIVDGLKPGEWVVVSGLQLVRPGAEVRVEQQPMPVLPMAPMPPVQTPPAEPASPK